MTEAQKRVMVRDMGWRCLEPSWECDTCLCATG